MAINENIRIDLTENGTTTLATAGKYCDRNIDVNADKVYEAGQQSEYDRLWDAALLDENGNLLTYMPYHFAGRVWTDETFKPNRDITPVGSGNGLFRETRIVNLKQCFESCNTKLDTSKVTSGSYMFAFSAFIAILPKIDMSSMTSTPGMCNGSTNLETIEEVVASEKTTFSSDAFKECTALTHMIMTGTLAKNGLDLHWSTKLDKESLLSIIDVLQDKTSVGGTWTVTLGTENLAKLTDAEKAVATQKGWTLV